MWSETVQKSRSGLAYRRCGRGAPVVLLHGVPGSAAAWQPTAEQLPADFDVIVPDLLGFGASVRPTGFAALHAAAQAAAIDALLDELSVTEATFVGHDFGGPVALALWERRPAVVSSLALLATNTFADTPIPFPLSTVTWPIIGPLAARLLFSGPSLAMMLRQGVGQGGTVVDRLAHLGDREQRRAIATIFCTSLTRLSEVFRPIEAALHGIDVPVFVGWGDHDPFFSVAQGERTARAVGTELRRYAGAGHFLPQERPVEVAQDVAALVRAAVMSVD